MNPARYRTIPYMITSIHLFRIHKVLADRFHPSSFPLSQQQISLRTQINSVKEYKKRSPLRINPWTKITHNRCESRDADPHHFDADPDPSFHSNADPDRIFRLNISDANLWPPVYRPFWASIKPPRFHCERPPPSTAPFWASKSPEFWL